MIKFKDFMLIEGAYVQFQDLVKLGKFSISAIDMRFEDWTIDKGKYLTGGYKKPPVTNFNAKLGGLYIIHSLGSYSKIQRFPNEKYPIVPDGWEIYAEFYNDNTVIKAAKYDAMNRLGIYA